MVVSYVAREKKKGVVIVQKDAKQRKQNKILIELDLSDRLMLVIFCVRQAYPSIQHTIND